MKLATVFVRSTIVASIVGAGLLALPACSTDDGEEACKRVESLCSSSSSTADGGASATVKVTCDGKKLNDADNVSDVKSCVDGAKDCNAAVQCLAQAKQ